MLTEFVKLLAAMGIVYEEERQANGSCLIYIDSTERDYAFACFSFDEEGTFHHVDMQEYRRV